MFSIVQACLIILRTTVSSYRRLVTLDMIFVHHIFLSSFMSTQSTYKSETFGSIFSLTTQELLITVLGHAGSNDFWLLYTVLSMLSLSNSMNLPVNWTSVCCFPSICIVGEYGYSSLIYGLSFYDTGSFICFYVKIYYLNQ